MINRMILIAIVSVLFSGCASVPMASKEASAEAKKFSPPSSAHSGIYVYRDNSAVGAALKKDVWIDGKCIGETARGVFFYNQVDGNKKHTISTESEFSPNSLVINAKNGENYYIRQYIKLGVFVGGANLEQVDARTAQKEIKTLGLAKEGHCSDNKK